MSSSYEPSLQEMRNELQVLTRAVSILFSTHPEPEALKSAWSKVVKDLKPPSIPSIASDLEKHRYKSDCAEFNLANKLYHRIGFLRPKDQLI